MPEPESGRHGIFADEPAPGVARLTISNPSKRGALDATMVDQLLDAFTSLEARCVILTGEGPMFSAGCDLDQFAAATPGGAWSVWEQFDPVLDVIEAYPYPTLAALNGHAIGAGLELALACDLRVAAAGIGLAMPPAKLGMVYSRAGVGRFIDAIGAPRTRELFLTARRIDAAVGLQWGLVNQLVAEELLSGTAVELAAQIASHAPLAQRGNKRVIQAARNECSPETQRQLHDLRQSSLASDDFREALTAFAEKRAPSWQDS